MTVGSAKRGVLGLVAWVLWSVLGGVELAQGLPDAIKADLYRKAVETALEKESPRQAIEALAEYAEVATEREWEFLYIYGALLAVYGTTAAEVKKGSALLDEVVQTLHERKEYEKEYDTVLGLMNVAKARLEALAEEAAEALRAGSPGSHFRDCDVCPEMVVVPPGSFMMGSEKGRYGEKPVHRVTIVQPFAVGKYEVTFAEWDACVSGGGCNGYRPDDSGWGRGRRPVIHVSWDDAQAYVRWLSEETGEAYRLLSEAEWEYVARAGTRTAFHFGETISTGQANYDGSYVRISSWSALYGSGRKGAYRKKTVAVGRFPANAFGLHDMHGNVWEWTEDCWNDDYQGAPADGGAWEMGDCSRRVLRGGSWTLTPGDLRSASRARNTAGNRYKVFGFRLARTLTP